MRKIPGTTKAQVGQKFAVVKIYMIIFFKCSKMRILRTILKKARFFGRKSRSGVGGFPYKCREFITEISKGIEAFE